MGVLDWGMKATAPVATSLDSLESDGYDFESMIIRQIEVKKRC